MRQSKTKSPRNLIIESTFWCTDAQKKHMYTKTFVFMNEAGNCARTQNAHFNMSTNSH